MLIKKHQWILYLIATTIIATISIQFYWNYKNYEENKRQITNEIQLSLDNALEEYYSSTAKNNFLTIIDTKTNDKEKSLQNRPLNKLLNELKKNKSKNQKTSFNNLKIVTEFRLKNDSIKINHHSKLSDSAKIYTQLMDNENGYTLHKNGKRTEIKYFKGKKAADSLKLMTNLKSIFISFLDQSVDYKKIDSLIEKQLNQKKINLKTSFHHFKNDTLFHKTRDSLLNVNVFSVTSKSTFVKDKEAFKLIYNSPNLEVLKRSFFGILLSLILSLAVISSLFYLLILRKKKAELCKNRELLTN